MRKLKALVSGIAIGAVLYYTFFGVPILNNIHRSYLRYKMKDVVYVTNILGAGGTGWVTRKNNGERIIITNAHVCGLADTSGMVLINYKEFAQIERIYNKQDLCAIKAPSSIKSRGFSIASSVTYGEQVFTLGHPLLQPSTVSPGELSGPYKIEIMVGQNVNPETCKGESYQLLTEKDLGPIASIFGIKNICVRIFNSESSPIIILPGNSGSPTVNIYGNVVACAHAANEFGTRSFHVPLSYIKDFIESL